LFGDINIVIIIELSNSLAFFITLFEYLRNLNNFIIFFCFDNHCLDSNKRSNCQLTNLQVFQLIVLMPFFTIKGFSHYEESILNHMFGGRRMRSTHSWHRM